MPALTRIAGHSAHHLYFSDQTKAGLKRFKAQTGAITLIQRFGSAANRNIHPHCLGTPDTQQGRAELAPAKAGMVLTLKTLYRDGTPHIVLSPPEFMQRLAALVPRLRLNLIRFHGALAPNAKLRSEIVPSSKKNKSNASNASDAVPHSSTYLPGRRHDHLRRFRDFSITTDSNPSFSALFLIELSILLGHLSHERQKCI